MTFITTGAAAKLWGITPRRVAMLAAQGRIPGAKYVENRWFIPEDAQKPSDSRKRARGDTVQSNYVFPIIPYAVCLDFPAETLAEEDKRLYNAFMLYEAGDFEQAIAEAEDLLRNTKRECVQIGALFVLTWLYLLTNRFSESVSSVLRCMDACSKAKEHRFEISLLMHELDIYLNSKDWIRDSFSLHDASLRSSFEMAYAYFFSVLQCSFRLSLGKGECSLNTHELLLMRLEKEGYWFLAMLCHLFVSILYFAEKEKELMHLKRAVEIAVSHNVYTSLSAYMWVLPDRLYTVLAEYPEEIKNKFDTLIKLNAAMYTSFLTYYSGNAFLSKLSCEDYILISYCMRSHTIERIAEELHFSLSKTKKLMVALYKKLGVKGKAELKAAYIAALNGHPAS